MIIINTLEEARLWESISDNFTTQEKLAIFENERKNFVTYSPLHDTHTRQPQKTARKSPQTLRVRQEGKKIPRSERERSKGKRRA